MRQILDFVGIDMEHNTLIIIIDEILAIPMYEDGIPGRTLYDQWANANLSTRHYGLARAADAATAVTVKPTNLRAQGAAIAATSN